MIQTEITSRGANEHDIHVRVPRGEYDRVYATELQKIATKARLPGFRPGKTPAHVIAQKFSAQLIEDTATALVQEHYIEALEKSGLTPAIQPEIDMDGQADAQGFAFTIKVVTWPQPELKKLARLSVTRTQITVSDTDVQGVMDRLMTSQVRYDVAADAVAADGDEVHVDYTGYLGDEPFEGGSAENARVVIGSGQLLADLEQGLVGVRAGDERSIEVSFPEDYGHTGLAGKTTRFEVVVRQVGKAVRAGNEEELAGMMGFDSVDALREDIRTRLHHEAEDAAYEATRQAIFDALLAANEVDIPEAMIRRDMGEMQKRMVKDMQAQGMEVPPEMFADAKLVERMRSTSEENLKIAVLLQAVRRAGDIDIGDDDINAEIERLATEYPETQREQFVTWIRGNKAQMDALRDRLLEKKVVEFIISQAKVKNVSKSLDEWQAEQAQQEKA